MGEEKRKGDAGEEATDEEPSLGVSPGSKRAKMDEKEGKAVRDVKRARELESKSDRDRERARARARARERERGGRKTESQQGRKNETEIKAKNETEIKAKKPTWICIYDV